MAARRLWTEGFSNLRWYHYAGGVAATGAMNAGLLASIGAGYRWYYNDDYDDVRKFRERYGLPSEQQRLELFRWTADHWDDTVARVESTGADRYRRDMLSRSSVRGDVLEVAVGTGRCFEHLRDNALARRADGRGAEAPAGDAAAAGAGASASDDSGVRSYVGVDILDEMLEIARQKLAAEPRAPFPARLERGDARRLRFEDGSFDVVIGSLCLCSMEHPADVLAEMARVCRPGGRVLLMEPGVANWPLIRSAQCYLGLVPSPKHAWETGWYDDLDPPRLVKECDALRLVSEDTYALGNWYLLEATRE